MQYVPFKWLVVCIFLPAVLYGLSVQALETYLTHRYTTEIDQVYIGDMAPLLKGSRELSDTIRGNIDRYLAARAIGRWTAKIRVLVTTKHGKILYPATYLDLDPSVMPRDSLSIAAENYELINEGLTVSVDVGVGFGSPLAIGILALYIMLSIAVLYRLYGVGLKKATNDEQLKNKEIQILLRQEHTLADRLSTIEHQRESIAVELSRMKDALKSEKARATHNESEMFEEIVDLDSKLKEKETQQQEQMEEIENLREQIASYEAELRKENRQRLKEMDLILRRFKAIYKNITIHERAVEGFVGLPDDMRIKAEELIHRLNDEPDLVSIKRKVFSKKGRETVLEVLFSYNGRLYFRRSKRQELEILAIGTKNTQSKDLEYINKVAKKGNA